MASVYKRRSKDGKSFVWRAVVRLTGHPTVCNHFERKQEAEDWGYATEHNILAGQFKFDRHKKKATYEELLECLHSDGVLENLRAYRNIKAQYDHWRQRLGDYALIHITPDLVRRELQYLVDSPKKLSPGTINRYMATLASTFGYAVKQLRWLDESPCEHMRKLKDEGKRDRVLTDEEVSRLLFACRESKSPYLYTIFLILITTGARRGEVLSLEWSHIDFDNQIACLKKTKNGRARSIFLDRPIIESLKQLYEQRQPHKSLVFASRTAFGRVDIKKGWQEALRRAGIHDYH